MKAELYRCDGTEDNIIETAMFTKGLKLSQLEISKTAFITSLVTKKHMTPFEFVRLIFKIQCSRACHSQFLQYRTASRLTRSLRFAKPLELDSPKLLEEIPEGFRRTYAREALKEYQFQVLRGVERQEARGILPLDILTEFFWYIDLRNLLHFFEERLYKTAQSEIRQAAEVLRKITREKFPIVIKAWEQTIKEEHKNEDL